MSSRPSPARSTPASARARVRLEHGLAEAAARELGKRLYFVSSSIAGFEMVRRNGLVEAIDLDLAATGPLPDADPIDVLERKINRLVASEILGQREVPPKRLWSRPAERPPREAFPALLERGIASEAGEGQVAFGEPLISLMDHLDLRLRSIALGLPNAREFRYPTLLPVSTLERFDYFASFPQFVMFVTRLHNDLDVYRAFVEDYEAAGEIGPDLFTRCRSRDYCLPPTMCYHTYHQHQGRRLAGNSVVTAKGKAFRYESKYHAGLRRLWDFTIREIVFLGEEDFALECRETVMRQAFELMEELELAGACELASDLFFGHESAVEKTTSQRMMALKYELLLDVEPDESIAAASFNFHHRFFGDAFEIHRESGDAIASGCVGFGLERLVYAFLCQHGLDSEAWPESVRSALEGGR